MAEGFEGLDEVEERTERFQITLEVLRQEVSHSAKVVEIGATQASFRKFLEVSDWTTVDKYGEPDVRVDLSGPDVRLPWEAGSVDVILCTEVLEHLAESSPLVKEFGRVLHSNGAAYISVPNLVSLSSRIKWLIGRVPFMAAGGDLGAPLNAVGNQLGDRWVSGHLVDFDRTRFAGLLRRGGLKIAKTYRMPITIGRLVRIPPFFSPCNFADFIFVKAVRDSVIGERPA